MHTADQSWFPSPTALVHGPEDSPREQPLTYPGPPPMQSVIQLASSEPVVLPEPRRLGYLRVSAGVGPDDSLHTTLHDRLMELNASGTNMRVPVLAIGSNANGAQMRHKALRENFALAIPLIKATMVNAQIVHSSFLSSLGYIPATLAPKPGHEQAVHVQFLDPLQVEALDRTEVGYDRLWLPASLVPVTLETGEVLGGCYAYVSHGGYLGVDGVPVPLMPQADLFDHLRTCSAELAELLTPTNATLIGAARADAVTTDQPWRRDVNAALAEAGLVLATPTWSAAPDPEGVAPRRYGSILPSRPPVELPEDAWVTLPTSNDVDRDGEASVQLTRADIVALGNPTHVVVRSHRADQPRSREAKIGVIAAVREFTAPPSTAGVRVAGVDEMIRIAVGIDLAEPVVLRPVQVHRPLWPDLLLGKPTYLSMRVALSDVSNAEREIGLLAPIAMEILSLGSGDRIVVESAPDGGPATAIRMKAHAIPDDVAADRAAMTRGTWGARFPSPRFALGAHPDLPAIYLDAALRSKLGLEGQQMGMVRVRASRRDQVVGEFREIAVVLAIALVGVIGLFGGGAGAVAVAGGIVGITLAAALTRLRRRFDNDSTPDRVRRRRRRSQVR